MINLKAIKNIKIIESPISKLKSRILTSNNSSLFFFLADWQLNLVWIGGRKDSDDIWKWKGRVTTEMHNALWGVDRPNNSGGNEDCVDSYQLIDYRLNDSPCSSNRAFVCEKSW